MTELVGMVDSPSAGFQRAGKSYDLTDIFKIKQRK